MLLIEKIITLLMICLLFYQIFLAHFRSKKEGYMAVIPKFDPKYKPVDKPIAEPTAGPVNNFLPVTTINMNFDPNSVITEVT
jgi:ABC-type cobalt transport system substrate-binding protein